MFSFSKVRGFTLVELMIAIAIIFVMLSILIASFFEARQNSRDRQRVSDLTQIQFSLSMYSEDFGRYPILDSPQEISQGYIRVAGSLGGYWDTDIEDPLQGSAGTYEYRVYPELVCGGETYYAAVAINMEVGKNSNGRDVCSGNAGMNNAYVVLMYGPIAPGGSINYGIEEGNRTDWWNELGNQTWMGI